jgi:HSP20 family molecular chaperone IbpA
MPEPSRFARGETHAGRPCGRSFQLPAHVTGAAVSALYDAGVLTVRVAGAHPDAQAQPIAIAK